MLLVNEVEHLKQKLRIMMSKLEVVKLAVEKASVWLSDFVKANSRLTLKINIELKANLEHLL